MTTSIPKAPSWSRRCGGRARGLFNAELDGNKWRAVKHFEGDEVNASVLKKPCSPPLRSMRPRGRARQSRLRQRQKSAKAAEKTPKGAKVAATPAAAKAKSAKAVEEMPKGTKVAASVRRRRSRKDVL
jgi:hypothetical protein